DKPFIDEKRRVFNIMSLDGVNSCVFGTVQTTGRAIEWAMNALSAGDVNTRNEWAASVPAGSNGLIFLPYLEGERSPIFDPYAKGVYFGLTPNHGREYMARAAFEGISYALAGIVDILRERMPVTDISIIGGGAKSTLWKQIIADCARVNIWGVSSSASGATSLGAAAAAGVAAGIFKDLNEATGYIRRTTCIAPNAENYPVYSNRMKLYNALYPMLKNAFRME
ncbi:MAG: hypothetical protein MJ099_04855, partial [Clostridia bacterium]|nr:hypothetical protein [Clostridia bacterium]